MAAVLSWAASAGRVVLKLLFLPVGLALLAALFAMWVALSLSCVAPALQYACSRRDRRLLENCVSPAPDAVVKLWPLPGAGGRRLAVRWSPGRDPQLPPVCIPNGLGATLVTIGALHDLLEARGYAVLSYDRAGVGMSDPLPPRAPPATADEVVAEMKAVMDAHVPIGGRRPWILVGPSMGSIVGQCYVAAHPEDVAGFLNMDGLPFPFDAKRSKFLSAAHVYRLVAALIWTGILRPCLAAASRSLKPLATATFPLPVVKAQMNQRNFYASLASEMTTMMDCCASARASWGPGFDLVTLPSTELDLLGNAKPAACGDVSQEGAAWEELPRSKAEHGDDWTSLKETREVIERSLATAQNHPSAPLPQIWQRLVVRVMSARDYNFGPASGFYEKEMQKWAAAEHSLHALLAHDGRRTVFPKKNHNNMFFSLTPFIAAQVDEIAAALAKARQ